MGFENLKKKNFNLKWPLKTFKKDFNFKMGLENLKDFKFKMGIENLKKDFNLKRALKILKKRRL